MIANCGELGLDYTRVSLGEYAEALEAHNAAASAEGTEKPKADVEGLRAAMKARGRMH